MPMHRALHICTTSINCHISETHSYLYVSQGKRVRIRVRIPCDTLSRMYVCVNEERCLTIMTQRWSTAWLIRTKKNQPWPRKTYTNFLYMFVCTQFTQSLFSFSYAHTRTHTYVFMYAGPLSRQSRKKNLEELKKLKQLLCLGRHFYKLFS